LHVALNVSFVRLNSIKSAGLTGIATEYARAIYYRSIFFPADGEWNAIGFCPTSIRAKPVADVARLPLLSMLLAIMLTAFNAQAFAFHLLISARITPTAGSPIGHHPSRMPSPLLY
jgi:hypothetical protein